MYAYVSNDPINRVDPLGLSEMFPSMASMQAMAAVQNANAVVAQAQAATAPAQRQAAANALSAALATTAVVAPVTAPVTGPLSTALSAAAIYDQYQTTGDFDWTSAAITAAALVPGSAYARLGASDEFADAFVMGSRTLDISNSTLGAGRGYGGALVCE